jgi:CHAD domain-containing protein
MRLERGIGRALRHQTDALLDELPRIREGDVDAIHDARIATRRLRAIRPVAFGSTSSSSDDAIRELARALGEARDFDVALDELSVAEHKLSPSNEPDESATNGLRRELIDLRDAARRRLIKIVEEFPAADAFKRVAIRRSARTTLRTRVHERAQRVREAIDHATGVYFPNRLHRVRIELKKLRYLIELAAHAGAWRPQQAKQALDDLHGVQDILGWLHDREVLLAYLPHDANAASSIASLRQLLEAERDDLFQQYLSRRDDLATVLNAAERFAMKRRWSGSGVRIAIAASASIAGAAAMIVAAQRRFLHLNHAETESATHRDPSLNTRAPREPITSGWKRLSASR